MQPLRLVVGTAGHIDHGKSSLVRALTGTDPDRLPEEKARGMTIDLGFAHAAIDGCDVAFVDVPGHERFIRNMVTGATGLDAALLIVAADDGVMPQTREHAEVLSLLGVTRCVLTLTKIDRVDAEWAAAVEQDAATLLASLGITPVARVHTSTQSGTGLDKLRSVLARMAREVHEPPTLPTPEGRGIAEPPTWFRLPIDRVFQVAGRGAVVTGTALHGAVEAGGELELWPSGQRVRARGLQAHGAAIERSTGRARLAINLTGVDIEAVRRGCELATPGYLAATQRIDVRLQPAGASAARGFAPGGERKRSSLRVLLHIGTSAVPAALRFVPAAHRPAADEPNAADGGAHFAQIVTAEPIVASCGQRFLLRDAAGMRTLGGGVVLRPAASSWGGGRGPRADGLRRMESGGATIRLEEAIRDGLWQPCSAAQLAARAGLLSASAATQLCDSLKAVGRVVSLADDAWIHGEHVDGLRALLAERLSAWLKANPRAAGLPRGEFVAWMPRSCPPRLREVLADRLIGSGAFASAGGIVMPPGHAAELPPADRRLLERMVEEYRLAGFSPPTDESLLCAVGSDGRRVRQLLGLAATRGVLVKVGGGMWLHADHWRELVRLVVEALRTRGPLTVADLRTLLGTSRKYMVTIAEHMDAAELTRRDGDQRRAGARLEQHLAAAARVER